MDIFCLNHPERKAEVRGMCKSCYNGWHLRQNKERMEAKLAANRQWQKDNRDHRKAYLKENADRIRHRQVRYLAKRNYGLKPEEFDAIVRGADGKCAICKRDDIRLNIDHCHKTGKVGSLLCSPCNWLVSFVENRPEVIDSARRYVEEYRESPHPLNRKNSIPSYS